MNILYKISAVFIILFLSGCATTTQPRPPRRLSIVLAKETPPLGIYHKVKWGESLWRIARTYNVRMDKIVGANRLPDAARIETGQLLFIPGVKEQKKIEHYKAKKGENFIWPVRGKIYTLYGAKRHGATSKGIEVKANLNTYVHASRTGEVVFCSDNLKGYGKVIIIGHGDGFSTVYAHNAENLVEIGAHIRQGETIAKVGSTGRADFPCLYFEIRKGHKPQNPFHYLIPSNP